MECGCVYPSPEGCTQKLTVVPRVVTVDNLHNTAGDVALSLNNEECYTIIRDAGIRSGALLRDSCL